MPLCPYGLKVRGLASTAAFGFVKASRRSFVISAGNGLPLHFCRPGFGSKRSSWLGPPSMNMKMTFFAFGGKCGLRGASGLTSAAAARPSCCINCASAAMPMPPAHCSKKLRRV